MANLGTVYQSILDKIDSLNIDGVRVFNHSAVFNEQKKRMITGKGDPFWLPAVWVEMGTRNEYNLGQKINAFDLDLTFHIVAKELDALGGRMDENLNIFALRDLIQKTFVGYVPTQCGPMNYVAEKQDFNHGNVYEYLVKYRCHYIDTAAYEIFSVTGSTINLTIGITGSIPVINPALWGTIIGEWQNTHINWELI